MKIKIEKSILYITLFMFFFMISSCKASESEPTIIETTEETVEHTQTTEEEIVDLSMYDQTTGRLITFLDDFNGDSLDETIWEHMEGTGSTYGLGYWGNNEKQYYKSDNTSVENGELRIEMRKEQTVADNGTGTIMQYSSSRIRTKGSFSQTYGRFEARVRIDTADQGLWPAFWLMPEDNYYGGWPYSGEIDIMEIRGSKPNHATSAIHFFNTRHTYISGEVQYDNGLDMTDYHVYAVEWTPEEITFFVDEQIIVSIDTWPSSIGEFPAPFDQDFHILLNFAVGGNFDSNLLPSDSSLPATMIVDYVRVLALDNEQGRKTPEGTGSVYLTYDQIEVVLSDESIVLEYFVFDGNRSDRKSVV